LAQALLAHVPLAKRHELGREKERHHRAIK
jgi:hypothetical protein